VAERTDDDRHRQITRLGPITSENVDRAYELIFAPWVKAQGLEFLEVREGFVRARLPQDPAQQFFSGALCGQALMSAIDTVMSLAMATTERQSRGTASQNNQFLRPAVGGDLLVEAKVLKFGRSIAYGDVHVRRESDGELIAHATSEFAF
jgi:uncharacterized protein (TIGR00369 family)